MKIWSLSLLAALGGSVTAQVPVFEGPPAGLGVLRVLDDRPRGPVLREVQLIEIEVAGATRLARLNDARARVQTDVPAANRLVLPQRKGSIYGYTRGPSAAFFGFFLVEPTGTIRVLIEQPSWGIDRLDPFVHGVAVDPAGDTLWVATLAQAGGDLFEIDLPSGALVDRTADDAPHSWQPGGLSLFQDFGVAMTTGGPLRFDRRGGAAELVPIPGPTPAWFAPDIVGAEDGSTFAFLAGAAPELTHVYCARVSGSALRVSEAVTGLSSAGLSQEVSKGPWLALSTDGSTCAWIQQGDSRELFVRCVASATASEEHHVTQDARFADTLNDSGIIAFISPESLVALIGDDSGSSVPRIEEADFYRVDLEAQPLPADLRVTNLSLTSGDAAAPYLSYGTLSSQGDVHRLPASRGLLSYDDESLSLLTVDWDGQVRTVLNDVLVLEELYPLGEDVVLSVKLARPNGAVAALYRLNPASGVVDELAILPAGASFVQVAVDSDRALSAVADFGPGRGWLGRIGFPGGATKLLAPFPLQYGESLGFGSDGSIIVTVVFATSTYYGSWTSTGGFLPQASSASRGFYLPAF